MTKKGKEASSPQHFSGKLAKNLNTIQRSNVRKHGSKKGKPVEPCPTPDASALPNTQSKTPPIDSERVEKIKRAIEKKEYKINAARTAEKLLLLEEDIWGDKENT